MTWNYRIIKYRNGHYGTHEVYYDGEGKPTSRTSNAATFHSDDEEGPQGIIDSLERALKTIKSKPVLNDSTDFDK